MTYSEHNRLDNCDSYHTIHYTVAKGTPVARFMMNGQEVTEYTAAFITGGGGAEGGCTLTLAPNTTSTNGIVLVDKIEYLTASDDNRPLWVSATGVEKVLSDQVPSTKVLINGTLYIIRPDGTIYNAAGVRVK